MVTPFLLVALPLVGGQLLNEKSEMILILVSGLVGFWVLSRDYKVHESKIPLMLLSLAVLLTGIHWSGVFGEVPHFLTTLGSFAMAAAYYLNWKLHRKVCSHSH